MRSPRRFVALVVVGAALTAIVGASVNLRLLAPHAAQTASLSASSRFGIPATTTTSVEASSPPPSVTGAPGAVTTTTMQGGTSPPTSAPGDGHPVDVGPATTTTGAPASPTTTIANGVTRSYAVGEAGTVVLAIRNGELVVVSVRPAAGWSYATLHPTSTEVEIDFHLADTEQEAAIHASIEAGTIVAEIEAPAPGPDD